MQSICLIIVFAITLVIRLSWVLGCLKLSIHVKKWKQLTCNSLQLQIMNVLRTWLTANVYLKCLIYFIWVKPDQIIDEIMSSRSIVISCCTKHVEIGPALFSPVFRERDRADILRWKIVCLLDFKNSENLKALDLKLVKLRIKLIVIIFKFQLYFWYLLLLLL